MIGNRFSSGIESVAELNVVTGVLNKWATNGDRLIDIKALWLNGKDIIFDNQYNSI